MESVKNEACQGDIDKYSCQGLELKLATFHFSTHLAQDNVTMGGGGGLK